MSLKISRFKPWLAILFCGLVFAVSSTWAQTVAELTAAAEQGNASAQLNLGLIYDLGEGVPEDDVSAYMWWNLATALGNEDAKHNKEIVSERITREDISKTQAFSRECLAQDYKNCGY